MNKASASRGGHWPREGARAKLFGQEIRDRQLAARPLERCRQGRQARVLGGRDAGRGVDADAHGQRLHLEGRRGNPSHDDFRDLAPLGFGQRRQRSGDLSFQGAAAGMGVGRQGECPAGDDPPAHHHCELRVGGVQPEDDAPARGIARRQPGEAVDRHADQPRREAGVPQELSNSLVASALHGHEEDADRPASAAVQDLEIEQRIRRREGEVTLELESDHAPEIRAWHGRQLHRLGNDGAARKADVHAPGADTRLHQLAPDGAGRVLVGWHAEGCDQPPRSEASSKGDHVDLSVSESQAHHVVHGHLRPPPLPGTAAGVATAGLEASDQRQARGTT